MVIVIIQSQQDPGVAVHIENAGTPQQVLGALQAAANSVVEQASGPKLLLPNGQAHLVPPQQPAAAS